MKSHKIKLANKRLHPNALVDIPAYKRVYIDRYFDAEKQLKEFVAFDTETTGLDPEECEIIQLSAVKYKNLKAVESWDTYINPGIPVSDDAYAVNGITEEMLEGKPKISWINSLFISLYSFINLNKSHIFVLFRYINPCTYI